VSLRRTSTVIAGLVPTHRSWYGTDRRGGDLSCRDMPGARRRSRPHVERFSQRQSHELLPVPQAWLPSFSGRSTFAIETNRRYGRRFKHDTSKDLLPRPAREGHCESVAASARLSVDPVLVLVHSPRYAHREYAWAMFIRKRAPARRFNENPIHENWERRCLTEIRSP
jgi:hypothetical protein